MLFVYFISCFILLVESQDKISTIEATDTQITLKTTKVGPVETMKITVDTYDLQDKKLLYSNSFSGILLLLTRGQYVINFLQPLRWYGIIYQVSQNGKETKHIENVMVKTISKNPNNSSIFAEVAPISIKVDREKDFIKGANGVLFSMKWNDTNRKAIDYTNVNLTLNCNGTLKEKEVILYQNEVGKNIEIKIENDFGMEDENNGTHRIIAVVRPKNCNKLCWIAKLTSKVNDKVFQRVVSDECQTFEPIYAQAEVKDYLSYDIEDNDLNIRTTNVNAHGNSVEDFINVKAIQLAHQNVDNTTKVDAESEENEEPSNKIIERHFKSQNSTLFTVPDLESNSYYAVSYSYQKSNPINYSQEQFFVVKIPTKNDTEPSFSPLSMNITSNSTNLIHFYLSKEFHGQRIFVEVFPLLNHSSTTIPISQTDSGNAFWLSDDSPTHSFQINDAAIKYLCQKCDQLCGKRDKRSLDNSQITSDDSHSSHASSEESLATNKPILQTPPPLNETNNFVSNGLCLAKTICFSSNIFLNSKMYSMPKECYNLSELIVSSSSMKYGMNYRFLYLHFGIITILSYIVYF